MTSWKNNNTLNSRRLIEEVLDPVASTSKGSGRVVAKDAEHLRGLIKQRIKLQGPNCDLNDIDVSGITDMSFLFQYRPIRSFNGDISKWDVSNVEDMTFMFAHSVFNGDISKWDVSHVKKIWDICSATLNSTGIFLNGMFQMLKICTLRLPTQSSTGIFLNGMFQMSIS